MRRNSTHCCPLPAGCVQSAGELHTFPRRPKVQHKHKQLFAQQQNIDTGMFWRHTLSACDSPVSQLPGCFELRRHLLPDGTFDLTVLLRCPNGVESAVCTAPVLNYSIVNDSAEYRGESECSENRGAVKALSSGHDGGRSRCGGTEVITTS